MRKLLISLFLLAIFAVSGVSQQTTAGENYSKATDMIRDGKFQEALEVYEKALGQVNGSDKDAGRDLKADILLGLGIARLNLDETDRAIEELEKSLSVRKKDHSMTYYNLALVQMRMGETAEATRYFNIAIKTDSKNAEAWFELGSLLLKEGSPARAKVAFKEAIRHGSNRSDEAKAKLAVISPESVEPTGQVM